MSELKLHYHPLSSYCWKAIIAFYENNTPFTPILVEDAAGWAKVAALWPIKKFPLLEDVDRDVVVPEASIIIEYLALHYPGEFLSIPADDDAALEVRLMDRIFDNYVMTPMGSIVADIIRPDSANKDPYGVAQARERLATSYDLLEKRLAGRSWAAGDTFSLADCAAFPALYYANRLVPIGDDRPILTAYLNRLQTRPSIARVFAEAEPFLHMFPG
ncbi:MAG: glutathione S-transferase family protein [Sphingomonadaceae bacterium]